MTTYDPIAEALGISHTSFEFNSSEYPNAKLNNAPSAFKGLKHMEHSKKLLSEKSRKQWTDGKKKFSQNKMIVAIEEKYGVKNVRHLKGECPHCKKQGQLVALKRWHFSNCKSNHLSTS